MAATSINSVADFLIRRAHDVGELLTHLKLQKLAYYAEAWHLALFDAPLTGERFEAWVHGPVSPALYNRFREAKWTPLSADVPEPDLNESVRDHLADVFEAYGGLSALDLERMTHAEEPWLAARGGLPPDAPSQNALSEEVMKRFYRGRLASSEAGA